MSFPNEKKFDFCDLFIFEMANNHQGSFGHGLKIVRAIEDVAQRHKIRAAIKLQFRDLDTFIHPCHKTDTENKHIPRFLSTRLSDEEFARLVGEIKKRGLITMCTPFDEPSVGKIEQLDIDVIKIGSCSAQDWPLLERVSETGKPVICSVGGLSIIDVDKVVSFFQHRGVHFALEHCVAIYPTPDEKLHLQWIEVLRERYPGLTIGFSTHEEPSNLTAIQVAYAKGARIFEKHVGIATDTIKLNAYSANPAQVEAWLNAYRQAAAACGRSCEKLIDEQEMASLCSLMRGVYAKREIPARTLILRGDVFFAMPLLTDQMMSGQWRNGLIADTDYMALAPLSKMLLSAKQSKKEIVASVINAVRAMLRIAKVHLGHEFSVQLSHHYGLENFQKTGCTIIECFNREYAKKIIVQLPGQFNPTHYHRKKDETFFVLSGVLEAEIESRQRILEPGEVLWVPRSTWHRFGTWTGVIIEEISTTSFPDDSFYIDRDIAKLSRNARKTFLVNWGRYQFDDENE